MWDYEFYSDAKGHEPVRDFLLSLDKKTRGKILQFIEILAEFGPFLPFPYSSQIEGKLRELRTHYGRKLFRVLYYQDMEGVFVLLHAFGKGSQKISERDREIGLVRMAHDQKKKGG